MTSAPIRVLLVEDNPGDARLIRELLRDPGGDGFRLEGATRLGEALGRLSHGHVDVVLLDLSLPDANGLDTFTRAYGGAAEVPIVVLTGQDDEDLALAAVKAGAQDYLVKGSVSADLLSRAIRHAIERQRLVLELRDLLEREQEHAERLRALDEMKNVFITAVAHDLRSPLTVVQGYASMLATRASLVSARREVPDHILGAVSRMDSILTSLLDLERLSLGAAEPTRRPTALAALVDRIVADLALDGHTLETEVAQLTADIDPVLVERILQNLLQNAASHTPVDATIWLRVRAEDKGILMSVEDDGPGVPDEAKTAIFEPFRRGDPQSAVRGSGVGLYLVSRFSELHGGRTWVEDRPDGGGSAFQVYLPARVA
jgi:phosphoserine phosphatase RsbU/P